MTSDTDAETRRIPGRGATRITGGVRRGLVRTVVTGVVVLLVAGAGAAGAALADARGRSGTRRSTAAGRRC